MAWCKVSSLTAAVVRSLQGTEYPATRARIVSASPGRVVEGWEVSEFLAKALVRARYRSLTEVMSDLESWVEKQG